MSHFIENHDYFFLYKITRAVALGIVKVIGGDGAVIAGAKA
jgi:hypothetical protein